LVGLDEGKFSAALGALNDAREKDLSGEEAPTGGAGARLDAMLKATPEPASSSEPKWAVVLEAAPAKVGTPVSVRARLIVSQGGAQPVVQLSWYQAGISAGSSALGTFER
jgi:hypothetical protein